MSPSETASRQGGYFTRLAAGKYALLITYRRNGTAVGTPVHFVAEDDGNVGYVRTWNTSGKVKRLRHTPHVEIGPSTFRGRAVGPAMPATAILLEDGRADRAARLLAKKHPFLHGFLIPRVHRLRGWKTLHYALSPPSPEDDPPTGTVTGTGAA